MESGIEVFANMLTQFGYPIVVSLVAFWYIYKTSQQYRDDIREARREHAEEAKGFCEAVTNNTIVMQKLVDKLGGD